ncbi:MAG TPA: DsbE family thiol:disulfide interchange protein [Gammaproteobacteria bacterium]|nr:DsbE family thiol:disulfide interchange protein [Gammaproteobacteria bacterium]
MRSRLRFLVPLAFFVGLVGLLGWGLTRDPSLVPSPLINKPVPKFKLPELKQPGNTFTSARLAQGHVALVNVWASWCVSCRAEHPMLLQIAHSGIVPIYGLDYKDTRKAALNWLDEFGDPYQTVAQDKSGKVGINWGVYGVPETYVVDGKGVIRYKQVGPITPKVWKDKMRPLIVRLKKGEPLARGETGTSG